MVVPVVPVVELVVDEVVDAVELGGCSATPTLEGHWMPRVRSQFLLTSRIAMSTTTSGRGLSRSSMSFCVSISSSGVPRTTMAFWLATP